MDDTASTKKSYSEIVVLGAGGFIGGHLISALAADPALMEAEITGLDIKHPRDWWQYAADVDGARLVGKVDLSDPDQARMWLSGQKPGERLILDFAADMGGMGFIQTEQVLCGRNAIINLNALDALEPLADDPSATTYVFASSACVYPEHLQSGTVARSLREEDAWPAAPQDLYGLEKLFAEETVKHYRRELGFTVRIPRFHAIYGPYGSWTGGREKAPAAMCRKVAEALRDDTNEIEIWGDGNQTRSFCYVDDAVEAVMRLTASDCFDPVNVGSSELVTINQLAEAAEVAAGLSPATLRRSYRLDRPQGVRGRNSDNEMMRIVTGGWEPSTSLAEGMFRTYEWVSAQVNGTQPPR